jgi:uncharacterized tellurite resistance protein B-like protein
MLDTLRDFVRQLGLSDDEEKHLSPSDTRLAVAALLVRCMVIDGAASDTERAKLRELLVRHFTLSDTDVDTLIADATEAEHEAVDLYRFTSILKQQLPEEERVSVIEYLWEIVYADGKIDEFEENLVWRVAELLGVNRRDRIAKKLAVAENKSADSEDSG